MFFTGNDVVFIVFAAGGRKESVEEKLNTFFEGLPGRKLGAVENVGLDEAADSLQPEFSGEGGIDLRSHHALGDAGTDEAANDKRDVFLPDLLDLLVEVRRVALQVAKNRRADPAEERTDDVDDSAELLRERELRVGEHRFQLGPKGLPNAVKDSPARASLLGKWT